MLLNMNSVQPNSKVNIEYGNVPSSLTKSNRALGGIFDSTNVSSEDFARDLYKQQKQNEFTEYMSSTQYQRAVEDMKLAGINPILAYGNTGNAGASGSSTNATAGQGGQGDLGDILGFTYNVANLVAGLITKNPKKITMGFGKN